MHAKEPWIGMKDGSFITDHGWSAVSDEAYCSSSAPIWANGEVVALVVVSEDNNEKLKANARRIVACVNACAGIPTEQLEIEPYIGSVSYKMRMQAEQQRDELLTSFKAARESLDHANSMPGGPITDTIWHGDAETLFDFMDAAIDKAESAK